MKPLSLRKNFIWTFMGQASLALAQFLMIATLARQYSSEYVGQYAFALAICSPIVTLAALRLRSVQAADTLGEFSFPDYLWLRTLSMTLAMLLISGIAIAVSGWTYNALEITILGLAKCIDSVADVVHGFHQRQERMDRVSTSYLSRSVTLALFFGAGLCLSGSILGGVIGVLLSSILVLATVDIPLWTRTNSEIRSTTTMGRGSKRLSNVFAFRPDLGQGAKLFRLSLPLGLTSTVSSFSTNIPRYFLDFFGGSAVLGVYAALIYPLTAGSMVMSAIAQSAAPRLANLYRTGNIQPFQRFLGRLILMGTVTGMIGVATAVLAGEVVLKVLYGSDYSQYRWILAWAMANAGVKYCYVFLGSALNAMRLFSVQLPIHIASMIVLVVTCWFLIKPYGIEGALASITVATAVEAVLYGGIVTRRIRGDKSALSVKRSKV